MHLKLLVVGDLHGNKPNLFYKGFDAIIAPGDFCSDAPRKYMFEALSLNLKDKSSKVNWYDLAGKKEAKEMVEKSLKDGREILEYLNSFGVPVFIVPGNWDWTEDKDSDWKFLQKDHYKKIKSGLKNIIDVYHNKVTFEGYDIIGHGITAGPEYPQHKENLQRFTKEELRKRKKEYEKTKSKVSSLFRKSSSEVIFLTHNVPFNTEIDMITNKESPRYGQHFGSLIARELIDKHHPLLCIGGHMHEHFRSCRLGKTTAVNAGFGSNVNVWVELSGNKIKKLEFCNKD